VTRIAARQAGTFSVIDTASNRPITDIAVGKLPWGVAIR
jgi:YVTN family beta-propeller protein